MSFVSYAQNFEDVMLWRALKHIENGFYIDIGAQDPVVDSVSLAFYQHGWRGVHVEPTIQYSTMLKEARPDETVEQMVIGNYLNSIIFYEFENTGLSTASHEVAMRHKKEGYIAIETRVPAATMDKLLEPYENKTIHWLKIDVEGSEKKVIESWCLSTIRPWILVIESTNPLTREQNYSEWENLVFDKGYNFAYFDGLNRFYMHCNHSDLLSHFNSPPNIFDGFLLSGTASQPFYLLVAGQAKEAEKLKEQAEIKSQEAEERAGQAEIKGKEAESQAKQTEAVLVAIQNSRLWRITAPWRWAGYIVRWFVHGGIAWQTLAPESRPRRILRSMLIFIKSGISTRPLLKAALTKLLSPFPRLFARLRIVGNLHLTGFSQNLRPMEKGAEGIENLSPRARKIYFDLKVAIEQRQKDQH